MSEIRWISISRKARNLPQDQSSLGIYPDSPNVLSVTGILPHGADIAPASIDDARALISFCEYWIEVEQQASQHAGTITKAVAMAATYRQEFHHKTAKNSDGTPARCRVNGQCKIWKTRPAEFKLPVKHGLRDCFYITQDNAEEWTHSEPA